MKPQLDRLRKASKNFDRMNLTAPQIKSALAPLVKKQGSKTKMNIAEYQESLQKYVADYKALDFFKVRPSPTPPPSFSCFGCQTTHSCSDPHPL